MIAKSFASIHGAFRVVKTEYGTEISAYVSKSWAAFIDYTVSIVTDIFMRIFSNIGLTSFAAKYYFWKKKKFNILFRTNSHIFGCMKHMAMMCLTRTINLAASSSSSASSPIRVGSQNTCYIRSNLLTRAHIFTHTFSSDSMINALNIGGWLIGSSVYWHSFNVAETGWSFAPFDYFT